MARPASDIAERILRAARERFLIEGVDGASLRAIARDAGTNIGMIYYYYPTKDDLFLAVIENVYAELIADLTRIVTEPGLDTRTAVERLYERLASLSDDEVKAVRLILREGLAGASARIGRLFERFSHGHLALLSNLVRQGLMRGEVRTDIAPLVVVLSSGALGLFPQILRRRLEEAAVPTAQLLPPPSALAKALAAVLFEGVGSSAGEAAESAVTGKSGRA